MKVWDVEPLGGPVIEGSANTEGGDDEELDAVGTGVDVDEATRTLEVL